MSQIIRNSLFAAALMTVGLASPAFAQDPAPAEKSVESEKPVEPAKLAEPEVKKEVLATGKGDVCGKGRAAVVHYTGTLTDGKQFDSSRDRNSPFAFEVGAGGVIQGWDEVVAEMRVGDRWKVTIPWQKAYGAQGRPPAIPAKADLVFDIELLKILEPTHTVVSAGEGPELKPGDRIEAKLKLEIVDGQTLKDSWVENSSDQLMVGRPSGIPGLDMVVKKMSVGDRWIAVLPPELAFGAAGSPPRIPANAELRCEFEIVRVLEPKIETIKEGEGAQPVAGQVVVVHYTGTLTDGKKFDSSRDRDTPFKFALGAGRVIPGWDMTLARMRVGQRVKVTIPWQLAYGDRGNPPVIPAKADLVFDIELLAIE